MRCLSEKEIYDYCLDLEESVADPETEQHIAGCEPCSQLLKKTRRLHFSLREEGSSSPEEQPEEIGGHPVRRLIDTGGMGKVWQAEDTVLDRAVAIKVIRPDLRHDPKFADSFLSEAKNVARLDHPNIVKVYSAGKHEDDLYLVMEFVDGVTLRQIDYPNPKALCTVYRQLLVAIQYAHRQGIIHRDIKSSNVMVTPEGNVKILDFGLSRNESSDLKHTMTGAVIGTIPYLSPELATGSSRSSVQSDIYALGVLLYEISTGHDPFEGQSPLQMLETVKNEPLRTDGAELAGHSTAFRSFLQRMVAHDLSERYENLDEALRDFDRLPETNSDELEAQATVPWSEALPSEGKEKSESPNPSDIGRSGRSGRWIFGIAALLVVLGLVYYFVFSGTAREDETLFYTWLEIPATQLADGELIRVAILPTRKQNRAERTRRVGREIDGSIARFDCLSDHSLEDRDRTDATIHCRQGHGLQQRAGSFSRYGPG